MTYVSCVAHTYSLLYTNIYDVGASIACDNRQKKKKRKEIKKQGTHLHMGINFRGFCFGGLGRKLPPKAVLLDLFPFFSLLLQLFVWVRFGVSGCVWQDMWV